MPTNFHGATWSSIPTSLVAPVTADGVIVAIGTAPIGRLPGYAARVNTIVNADSYATAVANLSFSSNFSTYGLCEVMKSAFVLYGVQPVIFINVLNPATHKTTVASASKSVVAGSIALPAGDDVIYDTVVVKKSDNSVTYVRGTDYTITYNTAEQCIITIVAGGPAAAEVSLMVGYDKVNGASVVAADVVGGVSGDTYTGIQLIDLIYSETGYVPGWITCPNWNHNDTVNAAASAKALLFDGRFRCKSLVDVDTASATTSGAVLTWKNSHSIANPEQVLCWPKCTNGADTYNLSTHVACLAKIVDASHNGIPHESPSNKVLKIDGLVLANGTKVKMPKTQADYLNLQVGCVTARNQNGWRLWGSYTAAYPGSSDVKDMWIPVGQMFNFIGNTVVLTTEQFVDRPGNRRLIQSVTDSVQGWLNSLIAVGALLKGSIEFRREENPDVQLLAGHYVFHLGITPPTPAQWIEHRLEFDVNGFNNLFA
jgi:phage tail sheath protein FI